MHLLLVRHGETDWNAAKRLQGQTDVPLNTVGQRQAAAVARVLAARTVHAVYASPLQRAWDTAWGIAASLGLTVQPEARLQEMAFGAWEGLTYAEIQQRDPHRLAAWHENPLQVAPPGGETLTQVADRVHTVLRDMGVTCREQTAVLVAHGGPLRILLCLALGLSPQAHWQFAISPASVSELHLYDQGAMLMRLNDTSHLNEADDGSTSRYDSRQ